MVVVPVTQDVNIVKKLKIRVGMTKAKIKDLEESIWNLMIEHLSLCKDGDMDKHYMTGRQGSFTRREYLHEFEIRSPLAQEAIGDLFLLAEDMMQRQVAKTKETLDKLKEQYQREQNLDSIL